MQDQTGLNKDYQLDNFHDTIGNRWAKVAARVVAENSLEGSQTVYNPLYIYGDSGVGKTHLLHAIGNKALETNPKVKVKYVTIETFANDFLEQSRLGLAMTFKEAYAHVDMLLLDNVHLLGEKDELVKQVIFQLFNQLRENNKQIVLASQCSPNKLRRLNERLVSRFSWGLITEITA